MTSVEAITALRHRLTAIALLAMVMAAATACSPGPSEIEEAKVIRKQVASYLIAGAYDELDLLAIEYRETEARTGGGQWKSAHFYAGFRQAAGAVAFDREGYVLLEEKFLAWSKHNPDSAPARIGYAMALLEHAWFYRGDGPPAQVLERNWGPFYAYLGLARDYLAAHAEPGKSEPHWFRVMMIIARAQDWKAEKFQELFDEAVAAHPYYHEIWYGAAGYLMPQWHGSFELIAALAADAVERTGDKEGTGMYARIYWYVSTAEDGRHLIASSKPVWSGMSAGFDDLMKRWPNQWTLNGYARLACLARDKAKTRYLLSRIKDQPIEEAWDRVNPNFDECRDWANGG